MRYTKEQYEKAIERLTAAMTQLEPDGDGYHVCGDSGHQAFECGFNPLVAVTMCRQIASRADELHEQVHTRPYEAPDREPGEADVVDDSLHEFLHLLAGYDRYMGEQIGPAAIKSIEEPPCPTF